MNKSTKIYILGITVASFLTTSVAYSAQDERSIKITKSNKHHADSKKDSSRLKSKPW